MSGIAPSPLTGEGWDGGEVLVRLDLTPTPTLVSFCPCVFDTVVVGAVGKWAEVGGGGQRAALSTDAERSAKPTVHLSTALGLDVFRGLCAKPVNPRSSQLVGEHSVNALTPFIQPCSPNSCQCRT